MSASRNQAVPSHEHEQAAVDAVPELREAPAESELAIRTAFQDGTFLIALYGEMDLANVDDLDRVLRKAEASDAEEIVVDLSGLHFIDSTGISLLLAAQARSDSAGNRLSLLRASGPVQRLFDICGLNARLPFAD